MTAVRMALDSILEKKGRSFLTMLGIIIGVCSVLVLVAMVSGYNADLTAYYEKMGVNKVEVTLKFYDITRQPDLTKALYEYGNTELADRVTGVSTNQSAQITMKYRTEHLDTDLYFGSDQFSACGNYTLSQGREIVQSDLDHREKVCLIGSYVAQTLFGYQNPVGEIVYINGNPFTVIGTYYQKDGTAEASMDDMAVVPYTLCRSLLESPQINSHVFKVGASNQMESVMAEVERFLEENLPENIGEYTVKNGNSAMAESDEETASLSVVLGGIAGIALLVGGIGIMNIMLVTVTERTREIGIKKAVGAPRREIVTQFLVEAGLLSALGGVIGIVLGYLLSVIFGTLIYDLILLPEVGMTLFAFLFSIAIGVGFGIYPAAKASGLEPVEALRAD